MTLNAARTFLQPITIWVNMIFVTWRLRGSLRQRPRCASAAAIEKALDRDTGERLLLAEPIYARRVRDALLNGDREKGYFDLHAWVVLHNHVHALLDPHTGTVRIAETVMDMSEQSSGRRFWERESWERPVRTQEEYLKSMEYIHKHPVRDSLVQRADQWEWSSAHADEPARCFEPAPYHYPYVSECQQAALRL